MVHRRWLPTTVLLALVASGAGAQCTPATAADATAFMGTWVINFTEPAAFKTTQTVRIWTENGAIAASIQNGNTLQQVTGILTDAHLLVLSINREAPSAMRGEWCADLVGNVTVTRRRHNQGCTDAGTKPDDQTRDG